MSKILRVQKAISLWYQVYNFHWCKTARDIGLAADLGFHGRPNHQGLPVLAKIIHILTTSGINHRSAFSTGLTLKAVLTLSLVQSAIAR